MKDYRIGEWQLNKLEEEIKSEQGRLIIQSIRTKKIEPEPPIIINSPIYVVE